MSLSELILETREKEAYGDAINLKKNNFCTIGVICFLGYSVDNLCLIRFSSRFNSYIGKIK